MGHVKQLLRSFAARGRLARETQDSSQSYLGAFTVADTIPDSSTKGRAVRSATGTPSSPGSCAKTQYPYSASSS